MDSEMYTDNQYTLNSGGFSEDAVLLYPAYV